MDLPDLVQRVAITRTKQPFDIAGRGLLCRSSIFLLALANPELLHRLGRSIAETKVLSGSHPRRHKI